MSDPENFETRLLTHLDLDAEGFAVLISKMREYRDRFVAHLDDELTMYPPELEIARLAVMFYYRHVVESEAASEDMAGLPTVEHFASGDMQCADEAAAIYRVNL